MISPPGRDDLYPGRLPPVRQQWMAWPAPARVASIAAPLLLIAIVAVFNPRAGAAFAVLLVGMAAASVVYVKNRTDRHNAAVDRGEIRAPDDPHLRVLAPSEWPDSVVARAADLGHPRGDLGQVQRFDSGWVVRQRNPRDVAVIFGDDGGWARFDPRTTTDVWAVSEYTAGRGHDG